MKVKELKGQKYRWGLLAVLLFVLVPVIISMGACNTGTEEVIITAEERPAINYFVADTATIQPGDAVHLSWDIANAETVQIQPGIGEVPPSGSITVYPEHDTEYLLTASNKAGMSNYIVSITVTPPVPQSNCTMTGCDPVSGRNQDIGFRWEQLCLCTEYRLQIAKDANFSMVIYDRNNYVPSNVTFPGMIYLAGGILNCGETYYVRVQCIATATGQRILTPWSETHCITIGAGVPIVNPHE